jgi:hypothetical protein
MLIISLIASIFMLFQAPIAQLKSYHHFADVRTIWGIDNFYNVVSNLPFLWVGWYGLFQLKSARLDVHQDLKSLYFAMFFGVILIFFGSSFFHLRVNSLSLFFDRLPMVIVFMALFSIVIGTFISVNAGKKLFPYFLLAGLLSIFYWIIGETFGVGDLRWYALVQFLPMVLLPMILWFFKTTQAKGFWYVLLAYVLAKLLEHFDAWIFDALGVVSGHSLKHIVAAFGLYYLIRTLRLR